MYAIQPRGPAYLPPRYGPPEDTVTKGYVIRWHTWNSRPAENSQCVKCPWLDKSLSAPVTKLHVTVKFGGEGGGEQRWWILVLNCLCMTVIKQKVAELLTAILLTAILQHCRENMNHPGATHKWRSSYVVNCLKKLDTTPLSFAYIL
jgi:hypothetical protein